MAATIAPTAKVLRAVDESPSNSKAIPIAPKMVSETPASMSPRRNRDIPSV